MLGLRKIAVTGGIASGKSSVCHFFEECGAYVINTDEISHQLLSPTTDLGKKIIALLGNEVVVNNQFNRRLIAQKVFADYNLLKSLETLLHPEIRKEMEQTYNSLTTLSPNSWPPFFVAEVPLLFESGYDDFFDITVTVSAPHPLAIKRLYEKTGLSREEFINRSRRLLTDKQREQKADFVLINEGSLENLRNEVVRLFQSLTSIPKQREELDLG
jgi:dephospho-CoA kinase